MLASKCPHCAGPVPLSLHRPEEARCAFCGTALSLEGEVARRLAAAKTALERHDASERQLTGVARLAVTRGGLLQGAYIGLGVLMLAPGAMAVLTALSGFAGARGTQTGLAAVQLLSIFAMFAVVAGTLVFSLVALRRARACVEAAAAAVPPLQPGEPARCHVCGAPLGGVGVRGLVRCEYCDADNVVDPAALRRASGRRLLSLESYAEEVEREASAVPRAFGRGSAMAVGAGLLSPFCCGLPTAAAGAFVWALVLTGEALVLTNRDADPENRYGLVELGGQGTCVVWFNSDSGEWERDKPDRSGPGEPVPASGVAEVSLEDLLGRRFRVAYPGDEHHGFEGAISGPRGYPYRRRDGEIMSGSDRVRVGEPRDQVITWVWRLCLAEGDAAPGLPEPAPIGPEPETPAEPETGEPLVGPTRGGSDERSYVPPVEYEQRYYRAQETPAMTAGLN